MGQTDRKKHMGRIQRSGSTCRATGSTDSFQVQTDQHAFPFDKPETEVYIIRQPFLPVSVQLLLYGGYLREDLDAARAYIFTRTHRRSRWLWGKLRGLLLAGLAYWMALLGGGTACALLLGVPVHAAGSLLAAFWALLCTVAAYGCLLTLVLNLLTIWAPLGNALVGVVVLDLLFRFALNDLALGAGVVGRLLPTTQAVLAAHDIPALCALQPLYFEGSLAGFTPLFSLAVTAAYATACGLFGRRLLNRTEL